MDGEVIKWLSVSKQAGWLQLQNVTISVLLIAVSSEKEDGQLDARCLPDGTCLVPHSYCNQQVCKCLPQYFDKDDLCVAKIVLGKPCSSGEVCLDDNAVCGRDGVCVCSAGTV